MDLERKSLVTPQTQAPSPPLKMDLGGQRETIRRSFLHANTTVAIILLAVLALALVAVMASLRATRNQQIAEQAQATARSELFRTYLSKARAARLGSALDRRQESLKAIESAVKIQSSDELRDEAIAALALPDFRLEKSWPLSEDISTQAFDRDLHQYAMGWANGDIAVHRIADNQLVQWLRRTNGEVPGAQGPVIGLEFSPEGNQVAARYEKGGAVVWDIATARSIFHQGIDKARQPLSRPRFTSDGHYLICMTISPSAGVSVFDLTTGQSVAHFSQFKPWMHAAARPGTTMLSINTESNVVWLLDWKSGETLMKFPFPAGVQRMAWSADGKYLAIGGETVDVHLWDVESGQKRILTGHTTDVRHLAFDPTGEWLVSASWDATSRLWETRTGRLLGVTEGFAAQFGENGRLALSRFKGAVEIWSIRPSAVYQMRAGPGSVDAGTWGSDLSPDGRWFASIVPNKGLLVWELAKNAAPDWFEMRGARMLGLYPEPNRPEIYVTSENAVTARGFPNSTTNGKTATLGQPNTLSLPTNFNPSCVTLSPDGKKIALSSYFEGRTFIADLADPEKRVWLKDFAHITQVEAQNPGASVTGGGTLALSHDGRWAVGGFVYPRGAKVWDARSGEQIVTLCPENSVIQFSPDDRWIAAGNRSRFQLFRTGDWKEVWRVVREGAPIGSGSCAFSPDGRYLAIAKSTQTAAILDVSTGLELAQLTAPRPTTIKVIRWSPDGQRLVFGTRENLIQIWELGALHRELGAFGLDWDGSGKGGVSILPSIHVQGKSSFAGALILGSLAAGIVTLAALFALRRHRKLIQDFAHTEVLADQRARELHLEKEMGRLKSSFVSMVSHEFRTPLGVITASAGNLQRYATRISEEHRAQLLGDIINSSGRMNDLIEEVLLLGKVESGRMKCEQASVDLVALCRRIISEVTAASGRSQSIQFESQIKDETCLDETLTGIIVTNLLNNAVKYSRADGPVSLNLRRDATDVVIEVRDEGIGIPVADQANLFKSFNRGANVGNLPGTGLGLTIVKRCVDLHEGAIEFVSTEGKGTQFAVRLPAYGTE